MQIDGCVENEYTVAIEYTCASKKALLQNGQFQPSNLIGQEAFQEN